jgi:hypothetical protein
MTAAYGSVSATPALTATSGAACTPTIPPSTVAGDLLIAHVFYGGSTAAPDTPANWTLLDGPRSLDTPATNGRVWVFGKIAVGSDAAPAFGTQAVTTPRRAIVYRFTGVLSDTVSNVVGGFGFAGPASTATIADVGVTTGSDTSNYLACQLVAVADDNAVGSFTGETGGDWTEAVAEFTGTTGTPDTCLQLQTAVVAPSTTINGGTFVMSAGDPWGVVGFYIRSDPTQNITPAAVTVTATAGSVFVGPFDGTGLRAWWKADAITGLSDGQDITTWEDSGSLNNDLTAGTDAPTYQTNEVNGLPCARFDPATSQHFTIATADILAMTNNASGFTIFAYVKLINPGAAGKTIFAVSNGASASSARFKLGQRATGSGVWGITGRRLDADIAAVLEGSGATQTGWQLLTSVSDWANSDADVWRRETSEATTTSWLTSGNSEPSNALAVKVGAASSGGSEFWDGDIAEIILFDREVSDANRQSIWDYFGNKYEPDQAITPAAVTVSATAGSLAVSQAVTPGAVTVSATAGSLVVSQPSGDQDVTPAAVTVTASPGSLSLSIDVTPAAVTVTASPGSLSMSIGIVPAAVTVTASPGSLAVMQAPVYRGHATTIIGSGGATSIDATVPSGAADGELLVAAVSWRGLGEIAATDGGWTERHDFPESGTGPQLAVYTRTAGASEPATYNFTFSGSASRVVATLVRLSDHNGVDVSAEASGNSTSPSAPSVTASAPGGLALFLWSWSHFPIFTPPSDEEVFIWSANSGGVETGAVDQRGSIEVVGSGATGARTGSLNTARDWRAVTAVVAPAAATQNITPAAVTVSVTPGSLTVVREEQVVPAAVTVSATPGSLALSLAVTPAVVTVSVTPGSLSVVREEQIAPAAVTVSATPGSLSVVREEQVTPAVVTVNVTPGSLALSIGITPAPVTVSITPGSLAIVREEQVAPAAVIVSATPGSLALSIGIVPAPVTVSATSGSLVVTTGPVDIIPAAVTVAVTPSGLTVTQGLSIVPLDTTVSVTPGSLAVVREEQIVPGSTTVSITAGSLAVAREEQVVPGSTTVTVIPGSLGVTREEQVLPGVVTVTATAGSLTVSQPGGGDQAVTPAAVSVAVNVGSLSVLPDQAVSPDSTTVNVTPGGLVVTAGPVDITPVPVVVTATPGSLSVIPDQAVTPVPVSVTATPGSLSVAPDQAVDMTGPSVSVSPGSVTLVVGDAPITPVPTTVTVAPGVLVISGGGYSVTDGEWEARLGELRWTSRLGTDPVLWWGG